MTPENSERPWTEDELLDLSVRLSGLVDKSDFVRPPPECIQACLLGKATTRERDLMQAALRDSASFRMEMLHLVRGSLSLETEPGIASASEKSVQVIPGYQAFLDRMAAQGRSPSSRRIWLLPLAAVLAVALAVPLYLRTLQREESTTYSKATEWGLDTEAIDSSLLLSSHVKPLVEVELSGPFSTPRQAALAAFQGILALDSSGLGAVDAQSQPATLAAGPIVFRMLAPDGRVLAELRAPDRLKLDSVHVQAWGVGFPSRDLYVADVYSMPTSVLWPDSSDTLTCIVLTASSNEGTRLLTRSLVRP